VGVVDIDEFSEISKSLPFSSFFFLPNLDGLDMKRRRMSVHVVAAGVEDVIRPRMLFFLRIVRGIVEFEGLVVTMNE
jgi:hypothetical protein